MLAIIFSGCDLPPTTLNDSPVEGTGGTAIVVIPASEDSQKTENFFQTLINFQRQGGQPQELYNFEKLAENGKELVLKFKSNPNPFHFPKLKPAVVATQDTTAPADDPDMNIELKLTAIYTKGTKRALINDYQVREGQKVPKTNITVVSIDSRANIVVVKTVRGTERTLQIKRK